MDDGCLDMARAFHVGCRGSVSNPDVLKEDREQGWTTIGGQCSKYHGYIGCLNCQVFFV